MTSEIKPYAIETLKHNHHHKNFVGDIFNVKNEDIPEPFSAGGKRQGFADTRGTLFFEIERIIRYHKPTGFILENVEGLVKHDLENKKDKIGRTLSTILYKLEKELGYIVTWEVLDSVNFGVPQSRKRVFIVGTKNDKVSLSHFPIKKQFIKDVLDEGQDTMDTAFTKKLGIKGKCSKEQIILLNKLFKERRKKHWAAEIGIDWMDGMPLTLKQIQTFAPSNNLFESYDLKGLLNDLVSKGYLRFEHPKKLVTEETENGSIKTRVYDETKPKGYNIVTGKLSFEINKILDPNDIAPTLVATDMEKIVVPDGKGVRRLSIREGLRIFGYPENYEIPVKKRKAFNLLGNTVVVPVVKAISKRILDVMDVELFKTSLKKESEVRV